MSFWIGPDGSSVVSLCFLEHRMLHDTTLGRLDLFLVGLSGHDANES